MPPTTKAVVRGKFHPKHDPVKMRNEVERLKTFKTWGNGPTWPIQPEELVEAGFYYVGILDRVKCFSCGTQIEGWEEGDTAMGEHKRSNKKCDVVKGTDKMNVTVGSWIKQQDKSGTEQIDGTVVLDIGTVGRTITASDILAFFRKSSFGKMTNAKNPRFQDEQIRLDTFQDKWRNDFKMDAYDTKWLANAGFYYTGPRDRARCFFCNGGIENWEEDDEPWSEHARNFPTCEWLIDLKGKAFVDEVLNAKKAEEEEEKNLKEKSADSPPTPVLQETSDSESDIASKTAKIMESPTVKVIQDTGCDQGLIRRMVEAQLRGPGLDLSSSDNFIRTLCSAEEQVDSPGKTSKIDTQQAKLFANMQISDGPEHIPPSASASTPGHQQGLVLGRKQCLMCKSNDTSTQFLPCSHEVACLQCSRVALTCPQCATPIKTCRRISEIL